MPPGIVPSANSRFPLPNVTGNIFNQNFAQMPTVPAPQQQVKRDDWNSFESYLICFDSGGD